LNGRAVELNLQISKVVPAGTRAWDFAFPKNARNNGARWLLCFRRQHMTHRQATIAVPETAEDLVVRNLIEALNRVHADIERIELWTAALACFQETVPQYQPSSDYLLPTGKQAARSS
jgi:hypothetical protein